MKVLVVDRTVEGQASLAKKFQNFDQSEIESLDLGVKLSDVESLPTRLEGADVLVLGSELGDEAREIARTVKRDYPNISIIHFVSSTSYSSGAFRAAQLAKVRKVFPENASALDLLQELVAVNEELRACGKTKKGKLTVFTSPKGGLGVTTIIAALAEASVSRGRDVLLWDMDIETRDLARALLASGSNKICSAWVNGQSEITRESLRNAILPTKIGATILLPPDEFPAALDLVNQPDSMRIVQRIVNLSKCIKDNLLVDTAGRIGPSAGILMQSADNIIVTIDDSLIGLSAVTAFLDTIVPLIRENADSITFLCSGTKLRMEEIRRIIESRHRFSDAAWRLPQMPYDEVAAKWAGTGKTLYSLGNKFTRRAIEKIAQELEVIDEETHTLEAYRPALAVGDWVAPDKMEPQVVLPNHPFAARPNRKGSNGGEGTNLGFLKKFSGFLSE